jgi:hypothetical protein
LGDYDEERFNASQQMSFPFHSDVELILTVYIKSIEWGWAGPGVKDSTASMQPLSQDRPLPALIDSCRPFIYLPPRIVDKIKKEWGLEWLPMPNEGYYVVNDTQHDTLLLQNPILRFSLGQGSDRITPSQNGKKKTTVDITLPYDTLWHTLDFPYAANKTKFIPIRSTNNPGAYKLGRTFLQEAYLTVDYERRSFSVAPALFPEADKTKFVTICAKNDTSCPTSGAKLSLPIAASAGVTAGACALLIVLVLALFFLCRSKIRKRREAEEAAILAQKEKDLQSLFSPNTPSEKRFETMELDSRTVHESAGMPTYPMQEMPTPNTVPSTEMPDESTLISNGGVYRQEDGGVDGRPIIKVFYEMDAPLTSTPDRTRGTMSSGDTLVATPDSTLAPLNPPDLAHWRQTNRGYDGDMSPIPQTPLEFYGDVAGNRSAVEKGWIGRAPGIPKVVFTPATPESPTPEEIERRRWLRGHSGRGRRRNYDD